MSVKVLVVDDSPTMRRIVSNTLKRIGYEDSEEAEDGRAALKKLGEGGFGLVITDWNMPEMNGLEFIKAVRKNDKNLPILMVTTRSVQEDVMEALKAGASNYIVKPFTPPVLKEKLDAMM